MIKKILGLGILIIAAACSSSIDTSMLSPEEHYQYAYSLYEDEDYQQALLEFQAVLLQYSGTPINDDAQYYLGMTYYKRGEYLLGAYEFSKLIKDIPASTYVPDAQYQLAECYYQLSPPYPLEQSYTKKAIEEFQAFIDFFPLSPKVAEAEQKINEMNTKLAEKAYNAAYIYDRMDYTRAAIKYYQNVYETYHDTKYAPMALYNKIMIEHNREMKADVLSDIAAFLQKYPDDENAKELQALEQELLNNG